MPDQLLTVREAAKELRIHPETLYRWNNEGTGPTFVRMGRKILYRAVAIKEFLDKQEQI
jgi:excisionase family DNA binding protein